MMKLLTKKLSLGAALCALFALGSTQQAVADDLSNGYYYIISNADPTRALCYYGQHLHWYTTDATSPAQVFYLEKDTKQTYNDAIGTYFHVKSLSGGKYFSGISHYAEASMYGTNVDDSDPLDFAKNSDGTFTFYGHNKRNEDADSHKYRAFNTRVSTYTGSGNYTLNQMTRDIGLNFGFWGVSNTRKWRVIKLTNNQLLELVTIPNAYEAYNKLLVYQQGEGLINIPTEASDLYGTGTPIFVSSAESSDKDGQKFANLTDGNTATYFLSTYNNNKYKDGSASITAPQFFQVDLGKATSGVRMAIGLRDGSWGASSQPSDITLFATNDETAAFGDYTIADCAKDSKWTKIGNYHLDESKAINSTAAKGGDWDAYRPSYVTVGSNVYVNQDLFLGKDYRYLRFYVNLTMFPNSIRMDYTMGELQLYNMDFLEVVGPKAYTATQLKQAIDEAKEALSQDVSDEQLQQLTTNIQSAIDNANKYDYVNISELGYASFYSEENLILPEGLTAYTVTATNDNVATLTQVAGKGDILPAKTPVILKGGAGTYKLTVTTETGTAVTDNLLNGTYTPLEQTEGTTYYVLGKNSEDQAALMKYNAGNVLHSGKAYLIPTTTASSKFLNFSFDSTTGIQSAVNEENKDTKTYDLEGRSVKNPQKGIYIRGGKKVIVK